MWLVYAQDSKLEREAYITPSEQEARRIFESYKASNYAVTLALVIDDYAGWILRDDEEGASE